MRWHTAKRTSPFKSAGASLQSTTGSRGVRISGSNAGYTVFRGGMKSTGYAHHSQVSPSLPLPFVTVCHHVSTGLSNKPMQIMLKINTRYKFLASTSLANCQSYHKFPFLTCFTQNVNTYALPALLYATSTPSFAHLKHTTEKNKYDFGQPCKH